MGGGRVLYVRYYAYLAVEGGQEPTECPGEDKSPRKKKLGHKVLPAPPWPAQKEQTMRPPNNNTFQSCIGRSHS